MTKIQSNMKGLLSPKHSLFVWCWRASNYEVDDRIWPEIEFVQDFMPDLVTCKFDEDVMNNEDVILFTILSPL